jgi:hypothetical protein
MITDANEIRWKTRSMLKSEITRLGLQMQKPPWVGGLGVARLGGGLEGVAEL